MAGVNNFLPFGQSAGLNVVDQATYAAAGWRTAGFDTGIAQATQLNKVWRQSAFIAACLGTLIVNKQPTLDALDDGNTTNFINNFLAALFTSPVVSAGVTINGQCLLNPAGGSFGGILTLAKMPGNALSGDVRIENWNNLVRIYENAGAARGGYLDLTAMAASAGSQIWHSGIFDPNAKANLASPNLTGTPTAPTAAFGTNSNQLASTAFVLSMLTAYLSTSAAAVTYAPLANPNFTGSPTAPTQDPRDNSVRLATTAYVHNAMPPGAVVAFAQANGYPGWVFCNGQAIGRATYPELFAMIGTTYGAGDGSTTFNVPELRAEFIRGADSGRGVDVGRTVGSFQTDDLKSHTHGGVPLQINDGDRGVGNASLFSIDNLSSTTATGGTETRPRNVALYYYIKY